MTLYPYWLIHTRQNLITYSEAAQNWVKTGTSNTGSATVAPDGRTTGTHVVPTSNNNVFTWTSTLDAGGNYLSAAVYLKAAEIDFARLHLRDSMANVPATGLILSGPGMLSITSSIHNVVGLSSSEWTRVGLIAVAPASGSSYLTVKPESSDATASMGDGIYIWGGQIEVANDVGPYLTTTDTAISSDREALRVEPDFGYAPGGAKEESVHRTPDGSRYNYRWGSYRKFSVPVSWVDSEFRSSANSWWDAGTGLQWTEDAGLSVHSVKIVGAEMPIARVEAPYTDQWGGTLDLETY